MTLITELLNARGGEFLKFYVVASIIALGLCYLLGKLLRAGGDDSYLRGKLNPYEAAFLVGGEDRVMETALARLIHAGAITVNSSKKELRAAGNLPSDADPVERTIHRSLQGSGPKTLYRLNETVTLKMEPVKKSLAHQGLYHSQEEAMNLRFLAFLPVLLVLLVGAAKVAIGLSRDRPVIFLVALMCILGAMALAMLSSMAKRTRIGEEVVKEMEQQTVHHRAAASHGDERLGGAEVAMLAAIYGVTIFHSGNMGSLHTLYTDHRAAMASSGGGGCGGSSGCGGGGGCGGCG